MAWNFDNNRPIYVQLVEQIKAQIISGTYGPGDKLPSVRELATLAGVNPNTMQRALATLETDGLIYAERTSGRFVSENVALVENLKGKEAMQITKKYLQDMSDVGYDINEARKIIDKCEEEM